MSYEEHFSVFEEIAEDYSREIRKDSLAIDRGLVLITPVDTGRAQSNWIVTIGKPSTKQLDNVGKSAALSSAESAISKQKGFETVYIQNNLPYIEPLNNGSAKKTPKKFIEGVIEGVKNA